MTPGSFQFFTVRAEVRNPMFQTSKFSRYVSVARSNRSQVLTCYARLPRVALTVLVLVTCTALSVARADGQIPTGASPSQGSPTDAAPSQGMAQPAAGDSGSDSTGFGSGLTGSSDSGASSDAEEPDD